MTLEQKIDIILHYIATEDEAEKAKLREEASNALQSENAPMSVSPDIDDIISDLLKEIGVPCHLVGYEQIVCAIKLVISDKKYIDQMTRMLYPTIASQTESTAMRVERGIRHAIECVWNSRDITEAMAIFGNSIHMNKAKPTNSEFISACVNVVKRRMKKKN